MTRLAQDDIRMKNRAGLSGTAVEDGIDNSAVYNSEPVVTTWDAPQTTAFREYPPLPPAKVAPITKAMDLDAAYGRYKNGKGFGRSDLFIVIIDEIKALKARIGAVDEARVAELDARMSALERTIGNALAGRSVDVAVQNGPAEFSSALAAVDAVKRGPGRPKAKTETAE